jgi:dipeptidyl aminopeptidase/acylaminoacyl peptidase
VVDPHGTTGHGRDYQRALNGQWGRLDVDDTAALICYAHAEGWATPETTVIIGASSGGLTVVGMLADYCELVAAGVASYPVSDVRALADVTHRFEAHYTDTLVGDKADQKLFVELSPINRAEQITKPLLIFHGSDDPVVPLEQSKRLVDRASDVVTLVVYEGEGHGFRDSANTRDELKRTAAFLRDSVPSWHL